MKRGPEARVLPATAGPRLRPTRGLGQPARHPDPAPAARRRADRPSLRGERNRPAVVGRFGLSVPEQDASVSIQGLVEDLTGGNTFSVSELPGQRRPGIGLANTQVGLLKGGKAGRE
jgi:hypothetical protein